MTGQCDTDTKQKARRGWRCALRQINMILMAILMILMAIPFGIAVSTWRREAAMNKYVEENKEPRAAPVNYYKAAPKSHPCAQQEPDIRDFPEIGRLLSLMQLNNCYIHRSTIPAGTILSAPGNYLVARKVERDDAADRPAKLKAAKIVLAEAGWHEDALNAQDGTDREYAEFRRILADGTRQYFRLEVGVVKAINVISLPTPRVTVSIPEPTQFISHLPSPNDDHFAELPPWPGFLHERLRYVDDDLYYMPADPTSKRGDYRWRGVSWTRNYQYDSKKNPALVVALLYKDALREAGWMVRQRFEFMGIPDDPHLSANFREAKRELKMSLSFYKNGKAYIDLVDIPFQRRAGEILRQWNENCVALISDLAFAVGRSDLSNDAKEALETLLEARLVNGRERRENISPDVVLELRGRADRSGSRKNNMDLGLARANSVRNWLIEHRVPSETLGVSTFGSWPTGTGKESLPRRTVSVAKLGCTPNADR